MTYRIQMVETDAGFAAFHTSSPYFYFEAKTASEAMSKASRAILLHISRQARSGNRR